MKNLFNLKTLVVALFLTTFINVVAEDVEPLPTFWRYDCSAEPKWGPSAAIDPANGTMSWENGIWNIETFTGKPFYPRIEFPAVDIRQNPTLNLRLKCTSDYYVFLKAELRRTNVWGPPAIPAEANLVQEIDSEGEWQNVSIKYDVPEEFPLDSVMFITLSFRDTDPTKFVGCVVEIDEIVLGADLSGSGIINDVADNVNIYPSIAKDVINVSASQDGDASVEIYDLVGRKVLYKYLTDFGGDAALDVSDFTPGTYLLKLTVDGKSVTKRFIKK